MSGNFCTVWTTQSTEKVTEWSRWICNSSINGFTLFLLVFGLAYGVLNTVHSAPHTPVDGNVVLESLPNTSSNQSIQSIKIKRLRKQLNLTPKNITLASQLATAYIRIARINSDSRYYGYAKAVLKPWWKKQDPPAEVLFLRATLRQHKHKYTQAASDLKQLLKSQPRHTQGWLTLATIQQLQGKYSSARASCSALARTASTSATWLSSLCHSQVLSFTGSAERAYQLQQVLALQVNSRQPELRQWVLGLSAETALRLGKTEQTEKLFKQAIALPPRDAYLLRAYSDYLLAKKRPEEVLKLLNEETHDDALLLRLTIAAKYANKNQILEDYQQLLKSRYQAASLLGSKLHERDETLYLLEFEGDLKKALKLALNNWNIQREPDDALILLRAAIANKSNEKIKIVKDWVNENNLQDARLIKLLDQHEREA